MAFAVLKAPPGCSPIQFGLALAACGDNLLVGAPYRYFAQRENEGIAPPGGVLFAKSQNGWEASALLTPAEPATLPGFGRAVALGSSFAAMGAPGDEGGDGPVHLYARGGAPSLQKTLDAPGSTMQGEVFHEYGTALAGNEQTLFVGAPLEDGSLEDGPLEGGGAVHAFERGRLAATLHGTEANENFGTSLAVSGNLLVVGAAATYSSGQLAGAAYVFSRDGTGQWREVCRLKGKDAGESFGQAVAIDGARIAVGAPGQEASGGRVEIYNIDKDRCAHRATLRGADGFGSAVALLGGKLAVGQPFFSTGGVERVGRVGLYEIDGAAAVARRGWLVGRNAKADAALGTAVALGRGYVAAGAPGMVEDPRNSGFVIVSDF
jgi:hypothetical protein